jgi:Domain of unknown function (DUF4286)
MGIIYNVTVKVENTIADVWLKWLVEEHGPQIIATNCFKKFTALKLLEQDDAEGITYAIQYFTDNMKNYERYLAEFAEHFRKEAINKWGQKFIAFRTLMQVIH